NLTSMTVHLSAKLTTLVYIKGGRTTLIHYIDEFLRTLAELKALGPRASQSYGPDVLMHFFKTGIQDPTYNDLKIRCRQDKWDLNKFITELRAEDLERSKERQAEVMLNRRVATSEAETPRQNSNSNTNSNLNTNTTLNTNTSNQQSN